MILPSIPSLAMAPQHHEVLCAGGMSLVIRPLDPSDKARLAALFDRLSDESRRRRFLGPKPRLSPAELAYFTELDHVTHEALAAVEPDGRFAAVSRYAGYPGDGDIAEIAVVVADELQGRGIGTALADRGVQRARANGVVRLTAATLAENRPAIAMLRRLGFRLREHGSVLEFDLELRQAAPTPPMRALAA